MDIRDRFSDLERFIADNGSGQDNLISTLHYAQEVFGYLPEEVQYFVARKLKLSPAMVYGVVSFYSFFSMEPRGRYEISLCMGTACFVRGAQGLLSEFENQLGIQAGGTTEDGMFSLRVVRCIGACSLAPVILVNDEVYGHFSRDRVSDLLLELRSREVLEEA